MDGQEGSRCQSVRQFSRDLLKEIDLPLAFWDERLSTQAVLRVFEGEKITHQKKSKKVDKLAASYILQGALDFLKQNGGENDSD